MKDLSEALVYPQEAARTGIEGKVIVDFVIDTLGRVKNPVVKRGVSPELDAAALNAVKQLKTFTPGMLDGRVVSVHYLLPVKFKLPDRDLQQQEP